MASTETPIELTDADLARSYLYHRLAITKVKKDATPPDQSTLIYKLNNKRHNLDVQISLVIMEI